jgi:hypothetical protein
MIGLRRCFGYQAGGQNAMYSLALASRVMGRDKVIQRMKEITDRSHNQNMIRDMEWLMYVPQSVLDEYNTPQMYSNTHILHTLMYGGVTTTKHNLINIYNNVQYDWLIKALETYPEDKEYIKKYHAEQKQQDIDSENQEDSDNDSDSDSDYVPSENDDDETESHESYTCSEYLDNDSDNDYSDSDSDNEPTESETESEDQPANATVQLHKKECELKDKLKVQKEKSKKIQQVFDLIKKVVENDVIEDKEKTNLLQKLMSTLQKVIAK